MERSVMSHKDLKAMKRINVSEKRQMTIPKQFYETLGMGNEIICELRENEIVLRDAREVDDFSEEILKDLVVQGFEGQELVREFQKRKRQIRPAVEKLITESTLAAKEVDENSDEQTNELFGDVKE